MEIEVETCLAVNLLQDQQATTIAIAHVAIRLLRLARVTRIASSIGLISGVASSLTMSSIATTSSSMTMSSVSDSGSRDALVSWTDTFASLTEARESSAAKVTALVLFSSTSFAAFATVVDFADAIGADFAVVRRLILEVVVAVCVSCG